MDLTRRQLIGVTALACTGCGGGGSASIAPVPEPATIINAPNGAAATATYRATLRSRWDAANFPTRFPASAHLTGLVGATHSAAASFWAVGRAATQGVKDVAERGSKSALLNEVARAIAAGNAGAALSGDGVSAGATQVSLEVTLTQTYPLVTLLSMLGPSPDWFIGINALPLFENGVWRPSVQLDLRVYDSGTDDGASFSSPDAVSTPAATVQRLSTAASDTDFLDGVHRVSGAYLATMDFVLIR
jgi:Spondin_N